MVPRTPRLAVLVEPVGTDLGELPRDQPLIWPRSGADRGRALPNSSEDATFGQMSTPFAHLLPSSLPGAEVLDGAVIDLEGHELRIVRAGQSDTEHSTFVHVPGLDLVVAVTSCTTRCTRSSWAPASASGMAGATAST